MSDLQNILMQAKVGLNPWDSIPEARWPQIAAQCGPGEMIEIRTRLDQLKIDLQSVEAWDGDTQDDIHRAIAFFYAILEIIKISADVNSHDRR